MRQRLAERRGDERGDTLIEVLIATAVIGITVTALLASLIETIRGSTTHRSLVTIDSVLKSFAESARFQIALRPPTTTPGPLFTECATSYAVLGTPSPATGPAGTETTVLGTGFAPSSDVTVSMNGSVVPGASGPWVDGAGNPTTDASGDVSVTFPIPAGLATTPATSYPVSVSTGGTGATTSSGVLVTSAALPAAVAPLRGYKVALSSLGWWNGSGFDPASGSCSPADHSGVQQLTFAATAPDGTTDRLGVVVTNPATTAPTFTSPSSATFTTGAPGSFTFQSVGNPPATYSATGTLPSGVTLSQAGALSGTPAAGTGGAYNLTVAASSSAGTQTQAFTLYVDQPPAFTSAPSATFAVGTTGTFTAAATGYPTPTFTELGALPAGLTFSGGTISGIPSGPPGTSTVTLHASNAAGTTTQSLAITVNQPPRITSPPSATFTVGAPSSTLLAASGSPSPVFSVATGTLPSGLTLSPGGVLSGTPAAGTGGAYSLTIGATNTAGSDQQAFTLTVLQAPAITSPAAATFTAGTAGSFTATATGYPAPTWTETGGLPSGVTLSSAGVLSGTPAAGSGGTYPLTLKATDSAGTATQSFSLVVNQVPAFTSANAATFTTGTAGSFTVSASGVPSPTISESGALPAGLTWTGTTRQLAGTPAAGTGGAYPVTFTASNGVGSPATQSFTLTVDQAPHITSATTATFTVGVSGSYTPSGTGYPAPTFGETGTLPAGLSVNAGTGAITGAPQAGTAGTWPVTITATNGVSPPASMTLTITVNQIPAITSGSTTTFTTGTAGGFTVTATGYPAPALAESGTLPSGVSFNPATGVLSGTPGATTGGTYNVSFTATNTAGTATQTFTLVVNQPPAITSASSTTFTAGVSNTFTATATGYPSPSFAETGSLPPGVGFSAAGVLSGTPTLGSYGVYPITITATSPAGTTMQSFTINENQAPTITTPSTANLTLNTTGSFSVAATGSPAPTFSESGTLPAGLSFSPSGLLSGKPTVAGTTSVTVTASNGVSPSASQTLTINVQQPPVYTSAAAATFPLNTADTFTVSAVGPPTPSIALTGGALPTGVTYNATTGVLSGTPTVAGNYNLTFTATNALGTTTQAFALTVSQAPAFTSAASTTATVGSALSFPVTASGAPAPTVTLTGGTPPTGVTFSGGVLKGTPAAGTGGTYSLTFTATSTAGTATQTFTLTVDEAPTITTPASGSIKSNGKGSGATFTVTASGFPAPTFSATGLPAGVSIDPSTGVISATGSPAKGTYVGITITATNAAGTYHQSFTLTVQ